MKMTFPRLCTALLLITSLGCKSAEQLASTEPIHVVVLHTNDVHGQVLPREATWIDKNEPPLTGGLPRVAAYINRTRAEIAAAGDELIVVDAGDWSQGTPEGQIERGRAFVRTLNRIDYDAMCLGNHEFDHGIEALTGLLAEVDSPVVCANLWDEGTGLAVDWVAPTLELNVAGMRVMVVGLLSRETPKITHEDARNKIRFREPGEVFEELREQTSGYVDWWLPITHLGHERDAELAAHPQIPLVVGGHSHQFLRNGIRVGDSLVVQAGCKATVVGRVDLWFDRATREVLRSEATLVNLLEEPDARDRDEVLEEECAQLVAQSAARMDQLVGHLGGDLTRSRDHIKSSPAGNLIAEVTRACVDADVGVMNRGGIRVNLSAGAVTRRNVFEICPFDNFVVRLEMTGAQMFEFFRRAVTDREHSGVELSGVTLRVTANHGFVGMRIGDQEFDPAKRYTIAMNSFMAGGGDGYLDPGSKETMSPIEDPRLLRELLETHLRAYELVQPDHSNHYEVVQ